MSRATSTVSSELLEPRRLLTAGLVDTTFDRDGTLTADIGFIEDIELTDDGKTVITGLPHSGDATPIIRYNRDGSLDRTFSGDGKVSTSLVHNGDKSLLLRAGKLLIAGSQSASVFRRDVGR